MFKKTLLVVFTTLFILCACTDSPERGKYHIGVSQCSNGGWRDKQNSEMQRELLLNDGFTMELLCADDNIEKQIKDIEYFINDKVDILIVSPYESEPLTPVIKKAYDAGIPVVLFDRHIDTDSYTAFVGGDNEGVGKQLAAYATKCLPKGGRILEITGDMQTYPAQQRHKGLLENLNDGNIEVLASVDSYWKGDYTAQIMDSLLQVYQNIDMIVAHSDWMASEANIRTDSLMPGNNIKFVGVDGFGAENLGIYAVENGTIDATVIYPTGGDVIIKTAVDILLGRKVAREILLQSNLVSTPHEALLINSMEKIVNHEVETVMQLKERIIFYDNQLKLEQSFLLALLALLVLAVILVATFFRLYRVKHRSNERLHRQQEDLTKQRDQLLVMTQELEEATNAKLVFFTNISHDFRTPLSLISAPIDNALQMLKSNEPVANLLNIAQRNVHVLLDLVNQILDFRKVENGKMLLNLKTFDLRPNLIGWYESFQKLAEQKNINMQLHIEEANWTLCTDCKKIERMIYNIIGNSMKFTPEGGTISMSCYRNAQSITITVKDTGIGISKENLNRIFERFYQIENSQSEGTGIGLALVKSLVELMHGTIEVSSNNDSTNGETGTAITLCIPVTENNNEVIEVETKAPEITIPVVPAPMDNVNVDESESRQVVLVIDDNEDIRTYLFTLLGEKYRIITASNGEEGLTAARSAVPDIILCDVMMPVMDGLECCRQLKNDIATSHIPVIMLTACSLDEQKVQGLTEGAEAYIPKPFSSSVLLAQIESTLKNRIIIKGLYSTKKEKKQTLTEKNRESLSRYDLQFLEKMQNCIEHKYMDENFNVEELSQEVCLSRAQLYRKCKALTGESPVEVIRKIRLIKAKELIDTTAMQISDIAKAVGIPDPSYFSKCYKTHFGTLPSTSK